MIDCLIEVVTHRLDVFICRWSLSVIANSGSLDLVLCSRQCQGELDGDFMGEVQEKGFMGIFSVSMDHDRFRSHGVLPKSLRRATWVKQKSIQ